MLMMMEVPMLVQGEQNIDLPAGSEILDALTVAGIPRLVVKAELGGSMAPRRVIMCGAGHVADPRIADMRYVGTVTQGSLLFSVFVD